MIVRIDGRRQSAPVGAFGNVSLGVGWRDRRLGRFRGCCFAAFLRARRDCRPDGSRAVDVAVGRVPGVVAAARVDVVQHRTDHGRVDLREQFERSRHVLLLRAVGRDDDDRRIDDAGEHERVGDREHRRTVDEHEVAVGRDLVEQLVDTVAT